MLVVSRGTSGEVHVFRGDLARRFLAGLHYADFVGRARLLVNGTKVMFLHFKSPAGGDICAAREEWLRDEFAGAALVSIVDGRTKKVSPDAPN